MKTCSLFAAVAVAAAAFIFPHDTSAQSRSSVPADDAVAFQQSNVPAAAQDVAADVEEAARRVGFGVRGGVGLDPELIDFGAHATFGPIFNPSLAFRPGIEFGVGEVTTMFGINLDVLYSFPRSTGQRWTPYLGAGPNFALSHRGFSTEEGDKVDIDGDGIEEDTPNRFDFSDTDFKSGFNFIAGARSRSGVFFEMNATAYGVSNIRLLGGFNF